MRAILVLSLAVTTAIVSTAAFAAGEGQGILKRRVGGGGGQQFIQPAVKPATQARFNSFVRPPVQSIAPVKTPIKTQFAPPVVPVKQQLPVFQPRPQKPVTAQFVQPAPKPQAPATVQFVQPAPKPVASLPVVQVKQDLPVKRQIVPEAADPQPVPQAVAPAPKLAATEAPQAAEAPQTEAPVAAPVAPPVEPKVAEKPADAQQLIEGDAAQAPKVEEQAAPAPVAPTVTVKPRKKIVRYYYQQEDDGYAAEDDYSYSYQPRVRYSSSYGGGGYGGCE